MGGCYIWDFNWFTFGGVYIRRGGVLTGFYGDS